MANTNITVSFHDHASNTTATYTHELSSDNLNRVVSAARRKFATPNAETMTLELAAPGAALKKLVALTLEQYKELTLNIEREAALANIAPIDSSEE